MAKMRGYNSEGVRATFLDAIDADSGLLGPVEGGVLGDVLRVDSARVGGPAGLLQGLRVAEQRVGAADVAGVAFVEEAVSGGRHLGAPGPGTPVRRRHLEPAGGFRAGIAVDPTLV